MSSREATSMVEGHARKNRSQTAKILAELLMFLGNITRFPPQKEEIDICQTRGDMFNSKETTYLHRLGAARPDPPAGPLEASHLRVGCEERTTSVWWSAKPQTLGCIG